MDQRLNPTWSPWEAIPVAIGAFMVTVLAGTVLGLAFGESTGFVLTSLVFELALAGAVVLWVRLRSAQPLAQVPGPGGLPPAEPPAVLERLGVRLEDPRRQVLVGLGLGVALFAFTVFVIAPALYALLGVFTGGEVVPPRQEVLPDRAEDWHLWLGGFTVVVAAPIGEELFFRGFLFGGLRRRLGFAWSAVISAAIFALFHIIWLLMPLLFVVGLGLAWIFERRGSLVPAIAAHASFNLIGYLLIVGDL